MVDTKTVCAGVSFQPSVLFIVQKTIAGAIFLLAFSPLVTKYTN